MGKTTSEKIRGSIQFFRIYGNRPDGAAFKKCWPLFLNVVERYLNEGDTLHEAERIFNPPTTQTTLLTKQENMV